ncbi:MAG: hypothetical protein ACO20H_06185 [Bacteriovoracaceae bacterium]
MEKLNFVQEIPKNIENISHENILDFFSAPTLMSLDFGKQKWLVVSILLHGNETVGLEVLRNIKSIIKSRPVTKNLAILIGNTGACSQGLRQLPGQMDFNRVWSEKGELGFAKDFISWVEDKDIFATIDCHNNTGKNPLYSCVTTTDYSTLYLGSLFSRNLVYFEKPKDVFSRRFGLQAPSVTLECGRSGNPLGLKKCVEFIHDIFHIEELSLSDPSHQNIKIYHTVVRVKVPSDLNVGFGSGEFDIVFPENIDEYNFTPLTAGEVLAKTNLNKIPLILLNDQDEVVTDQYLKLNGNHICFKKDVVPSMFTKCIDIMKSDSFGYLMEDYHL